jgi:hypothetical protein
MSYRHLKSTDDTSQGTTELSASPSTPGLGVPTPDISQRSLHSAAVQAVGVLGGCPLIGINSGSPLLSPSGRWVPGCLRAQVCMFYISLVW